MIMIMKTRLLILFLMAAAAVSTVSARAVPKEKITYDVMYKWGLINKKAGSVALVTNPGARRFFCYLSRGVVDEIPGHAYGCDCSVGRQVLSCA